MSNKILQSEEKYHTRACVILFMNEKKHERDTIIMELENWPASFAILGLD